MKGRLRKKDRKTRRALAALDAALPQDDDIPIRVVEASYRVSVTITHTPSGKTASAAAATEEAARAWAFESLYSQLGHGTQAPKS